MDVLYRVDHKEIFKLCEIIPELESYIFMSFDKKYDDFYDLLKMLKNKQPEIKTPYMNAGRALGLHEREQLGIIPSEKRKEILFSHVQKLEELLSDPKNIVYIQSYLKQKRFLETLRRPKICKETADQLSRSISHEHISQKVKEFGESEEKTEYSMSGTATGRLTVRSGPNILTLPSSARKAILPTKKDSKILQVDLTAAEPHMALLVAKKAAPDDIYDYISKGVLAGALDRSHSKIVILSALYGQSAGNLSKKLPDEINARDVIRKTKEYFEIDTIKKQLVRDLYEGSLRNILGRPLWLEKERADLVISHFLQSSVAECSILLFSSFYKEFSNLIKPYYIIHDALIFECEKQLAFSFLEKKNIELSLGTWKFQAKITEV